MERSKYSITIIKHIIQSAEIPIKEEMEALDQLHGHPDSDNGFGGYFWVRTQIMSLKIFGSKFR